MNQLNEGKSAEILKIWLEKLRIWIKNNLFLIIIVVLNILLHIPRSSHMNGNDAYTVVWMAQAMSEGWFEAWTVHPLSVLGYFPYSKYPVGGILILALFLKMGMSIDLAVYMFSFLFMLVGIISSYFLGKTLFKTDKNSVGWFTLFFTLSPIFIDLTNWTSSVRGPFLSVLPLALAFIIKFTKKPNLRNGIGVIISSVLLLFLHALFVGYVVYFIAAILTFIILRLSKSKKMNKLQNVEFLSKYRVYVILFIYLVLLMTSILVIGAKGWIINIFTQQPAYIQTLDYNPFIIFILLILNYAVYEYGLITILFLAGFIVQFKDSLLEEKENRTFLLTLGLFASIIVIFTDYGPLFVLPWICFYATIFMKYLHSRLNDKKKYLLTAQIWIIYILYIQRIGLTSMTLLFTILLAVGTLILIGLSVFENVTTKINLPQIWRKVAFATVVLLTLSATIFTSLDNGSNFPGYNLSEDEIIIAEYLQMNNAENSLIVSYNERIARRIQAFGFQPVIPSQNPPSMLYYNYLYLNSEYILNSVEFDFLKIIRYGTPYVANVTELSFEMFYMYEKILELDLRNITDYNTAIEDYNVGYVLLSTDVSENIPILDFSSNLFESILDTGYICIETEHLALYALSSP